MPGHVAVIGSGTWGTTLALLAVRAGQRAVLTFRDEAEALGVQRSRRHDRALPGVLLPNDLVATSDRTEAVRGAAVVVLAVPSQAMRDTVRQVAPSLDGAIIVSASKGLEEGSLKRMSQVIAEELAAAGQGATPIVVLSGPNLAPEIAAGKPAATVLASTDPEAAEAVRQRLMHPNFRCYTNPDVIGVEMGGALKNVVAIGAGIGAGLHVGNNAIATFMTRGIAEIARLGVAAGARALTFSGLAGLGDLIATCSSELSRNHTVGRQLAAGRSLTEITAELGHVAEGVPTTRAARDLSRRLTVEMPITEQMYRVLFEGHSPRDAIAELMQRQPKDELAGLLLP